MRKGFQSSLIQNLFSHRHAAPSAFCLLMCRGTGFPCFILMHLWDPLFSLGTKCCNYSQFLISWLKESNQAHKFTDACFKVDRSYSPPTERRVWMCDPPLNPDQNTSWPRLCLLKIHYITSSSCWSWLVYLCSFLRRYAHSFFILCQKSNVSEFTTPRPPLFFTQQVLLITQQVRLHTLTVQASSSSPKHRCKILHKEQSVNRPVF